MSEVSEDTPANPTRHGIRKGIYIIPSAFTIGNILCGFYAVINAVKGYQAIGDPSQADYAAHLFNNAARAIGLAFLLDGLDGRIARMTKATSEFGVELDSIADVITFGVAPAVVAFAWGYGLTPGLESFAWGISFFYLMCGALRLARFNVVARAPRFTIPGNSPKLDKRYFVGLPIPAAASLLAAIIHFVPQPLSLYQREQSEFYSLGLMLIMAALAVLMVSNFRYTSFKNLSLKSNKPFLTLPLLSLLIAGIWFYSRPVLLAIAFTYVSHGLVLKLWSLVRRIKRPITTEESPTSTIPD